MPFRGALNGTDGPGNSARLCLVWIPDLGMHPSCLGVTHGAGAFPREARNQRRWGAMRGEVKLKQECAGREPRPPDGTPLGSGMSRTARVPRRLSTLEPAPDVARGLAAAVACQVRRE